MAGRTQAGTTTGRRHPAHTRVTRCRLVKAKTDTGSHAVDHADQACGSPRSKQQINSHTGDLPVPTCVEVLPAYSHPDKAADLRLCHTMALANPVRTARSSMQRPWSLRERLDERDIAN